MTAETPAPAPTTEVPVEMPAKVETTTEVTAAPETGAPTINDAPDVTVVVDSKES